MNENSGRMYLGRGERADFDDLFDFCDRDFGGCGAHRIEVHRGVSINQVAEAVGLPRFDDREIAGDRRLQHMQSSAEFSRFLLVAVFRDGTATGHVAQRQPTITDCSACARGCEEGGNSGAACTQSFRECALRHEFHFELTLQVLSFELFVLANVAAHHLFDLLVAQQNTESEIVDAAVVRHDREFGGPEFGERADAVFGDAAEAEATGEDRRSTLDVGARIARRLDDLVHGSGKLPKDGVVRLHSRSMISLQAALATQRRCACACAALMTVEQRTRGVEALYACDDMLRGYGYEPDYDRRGDFLFRAAQKKADPDHRVVAVRFGECVHKRLLGSMLHELLHAAFGEPPKANYAIPWGMPYSVPNEVAVKDEEAFIARFNESEARSFVGVAVMAKARFDIDWEARTARDVGTYCFVGGNALVPAPKGFRPVAHFDRQHHEHPYYQRAKRLEDAARTWFADTKNVESLMGQWKEREALGRASRKTKLPPPADFGRMAPKKTLSNEPCICGSEQTYAACCMRLGSAAAVSVIAR
jgi:SEC-C motif